MFSVISLPFLCICFQAFFFGGGSGGSWGGEGEGEGKEAIIFYRSKGELRRDERKMIEKVGSF